MAQWLSPGGTDPSPTQSPDEPPALNFEAVPRPDQVTSWPAYYAFLTAWLRPAATGRNMTHIGLFQAFEVHLVSWILYFLGDRMLFGILSDASPLIIWHDMAQGIAQHPVEFLVGLGIFVTAVESLSLLLAVLITPWGAREEKYRSSLYHAMRMVWLQTPLMTAAGLAVVSFVVAFEACFNWQQYTLAWNEQPWYLRHMQDCMRAAFTAACAWFIW